MQDAALILTLIAVGACGSSPTAPDAGTHPDGSDGSFPTTCTDACRTTSLSAVFGSDTRILDHAYYGVTSVPAGMSLHVEVYRGGAGGCPMEQSPTPDYTVVLGEVPIPTSTAELTSSGSLLDYVGDLLDGPLGTSTMAVAVVPVAANLVVGELALDVAITFAAGTVSGHLFATHCASLDATQTTKSPAAAR